jgi:hypothetical protein
MKYFVRYSTGPYDGDTQAEFDRIEDVVDLLTRNAWNREFTFEVIHGTRIEFEPAEIIKSYRVKT